LSYRCEMRLEHTERAGKSINGNKSDLDFFSNTTITIRLTDRAPHNILIIILLCHRRYIIIIIIIIIIGVVVGIRRRTLSRCIARRGRPCLGDGCDGEAAAACGFQRRRVGGTKLGGGDTRSRVKNAISTRTTTATTTSGSFKNGKERLWVTVNNNNNNNIAIAVSPDSGDYIIII